MVWVYYCDSCNANTVWAGEARTRARTRGEEDGGGVGKLLKFWSMWCFCLPLSLDLGRAGIFRLCPPLIPSSGCSVAQGNQPTSILYAQHLNSLHHEMCQSPHPARLHAVLYSISD